MMHHITVTQQLCRNKIFWQIRPSVPAAINLTNHSTLDFRARLKFFESVDRDTYPDDDGLESPAMLT